MYSKTCVKGTPVEKPNCRGRQAARDLSFDIFIGFTMIRRRFSGFRSSLKRTAPITLGAKFYIGRSGAP